MSVRSSSGDTAVIFWLLFHPGKSNVTNGCKPRRISITATRGNRQSFDTNASRDTIFVYQITNAIFTCRLEVSARKNDFATCRFDFSDWKNDFATCGFDFSARRNDFVTCRLDFSDWKNDFATCRLHFSARRPLICMLRKGKRDC